ncbi:PBECR4 domain-containing protein [Selenomonas sp. ND2010]|uniref:PBECR4 domain-containing protein n=1 Tax=Selenomonas sp. ND2010 TaxID=1410618 RepID=UPI00051C9E3A|nr:PBECR4 domain-containing protein [Selenomonas sp. ND2010]
MAHGNLGTRRQADRRRVVETIKQAARIYKEHLVGKTFMYVFDGRYIEVLYKAANFKHLTGVDSPLSAKEFYRSAVRRQLQVNQIGFTARHPYELCCRKLQHLEEVANLAGAESFLLEEITTQTRSYKFGTTDLKFTLCMNKEQDADGNEKGNCYIVESLRDEDCFQKSKDVFAVSHIFVKPNDAKLYGELLFQDKNASVLPEYVFALMNEELRRTIDC